VAGRALPFHRLVARGDAGAQIDCRLLRRHLIAVVAEQLDAKARKQPVRGLRAGLGGLHRLHRLRLVVFVCGRRAGVIGVAADDHIGQHPAPGLPAAHGATDRLAPHHHIHLDGGAAADGDGGMFGCHSKTDCKPSLRTRNGPSRFTPPHAQHCPGKP